MKKFRVKKDRLPRSFFVYQDLARRGQVIFVLWHAVERLEDEADKLNRKVNRLTKQIKDSKLL